METAFSCSQTDLGGLWAEDLCKGLGFRVKALFHGPGLRAMAAAA